MSRRSKPQTALEAVLSVGAVPDRTLALRREAVAWEAAEQAKREQRNARRRRRRAERAAGATAPVPGPADVSAAAEPELTGPGPRPVDPALHPDTPDALGLVWCERSASKT